MNANEIKFRCSSLGHLMTDPREKAKKESGELAETVKTHLVDVFVSAKYGRREEIMGKYLDKGNEREEDAITLVSRVTKRFYKKNTERLTNDYISGELDLFLGETVDNADETIDTKVSWSANTFFRAKNKPLDKMYEWQGVGYMALSGAKKHTVAYCLVNGTESAIANEKRILSYQNGMMDAGGNPSLEFIERCKQIEINHIFDLAAFQKEYPHYDFANDVSKWTYDIPMEERLFMISFERDEAEIERLYQRIRDCRRWMNENLFMEVLTPKETVLV
jgi:hypothetical protein